MPDGLDGRGCAEGDKPVDFGRLEARLRVRPAGVATVWVRVGADQPGGASAITRWWQSRNKSDSG